MLVGLLFSVMTGPLAAQNDPLLHWQDKAYIERSFYKIALNNEYESGQQVLRRWEEPIRYHILFEDLPNNAMVQTLVKTHFDHLAAITGVSIRAVKTQRQANFLVVLTRDRHYQKSIQTHTRAREPGLHTDSHCMASIQVSGDGRLRQAQVVIPLDHAMQRGLLPACVVEETTQAMGLPNDADDVTPSIANDASRLDLLTGLDYVFLKLLYHPQLRAGMSQTALQQRLPTILDKFEQQGLIEGAARTVNREGLYRLLY
jgi:hypothetical protein